MWASAQRDGCPAEYRYRCLFNAAKFGWCPLPECRAVTLPRRDSRWNLLGAPNSQTDLSRYWVEVRRICGDMWRRYCCLTSFFLIVDTYLSCEDSAREICAMVPRWWFFALFLCPVFPVSCMQHISDLHSKLALRPHHVWKYGRHPLYDRWD